jgi:mono/diheme cytochrome c family protein
MKTARAFHCAAGLRAARRAWPVLLAAAALIGAVSLADAGAEPNAQPAGNAVLAPARAPESMDTSALASAHIDGKAALAPAHAPVHTETSTPASASVEGNAALARQHWVLNCMGCHTATGGGIPGKVPPLAGSLGYFEHLPAGREYVMRVPGASNSALTDAELADVLNWLLTTMNRDALPRDFKPYTAAEVAAHRRPAFADVATVRTDLIRKLRERGIEGVAEHY